MKAFSTKNVANMRAGSRNSGYIIIVMVILFSALGLILVLGGAVPIVSHFSSMQGYGYSKQALLASNSAVSEALYRLNTGKNLPNSVTVTLSSGSATITTTATPNGKKIAVNGSQKAYQRNMQADLSYGSGVAFHYGVQTGQGGFDMKNSSTITGNVYSSGAVTGDGNNISGDVISAGSGGVIDGIHTTGSAYAHQIKNSTVARDAYYTTISNTTVNGVSYPSSPDQPAVPLPISDDQIADWEAATTLDTTVCSGGTYNISSNKTLGDIKIPCNLNISGSPTVTVTGHIWVTGNITIQNSAKIKMAASLGATNVAIIADNPSNRLTSSIINIQNTASFEDSGTPGSYVFMISQNNSAENGGSVAAISLSNNTNTLVAYAAHGYIPLVNSVSLKEVTAYKIGLQNSANVTYDTGLPNVLFEAGPGGGYNILDWFEY